MNREFTFEAETPVEHKPCGCGKKEIETEQFEFGEAEETFEFDEAEAAFEFDEAGEEGERGRPPARRAAARPGGRPGMGSGPRRPASGMNRGGMKPGMGAKPWSRPRPTRPGIGAKPGMGRKPVRPGTNLGTRSTFSDVAATSAALLIDLTKSLADSRSFGVP